MEEVSLKTFSPGLENMWLKLRQKEVHISSSSLLSLFSYSIDKKLSITPKVGELELLLKSFINYRGIGKVQGSKNISLRKSPLKINKHFQYKKISNEEILSSIKQLNEYLTYLSGINSNVYEAISLVFLILPAIFKFEPPTLKNDKEALFDELTHLLNHIYSMACSLSSNKYISAQVYHAIIIIALALSKLYNLIYETKKDSSMIFHREFLKITDSLIKDEEYIINNEHLKLMREEIKAYIETPA